MCYKGGMKGRRTSMIDVARISIIGRGYQNKCLVNKENFATGRGLLKAFHKENNNFRDANPCV